MVYHNFVLFFFIKINTDLKSWRISFRCFGDSETESRGHHFNQKRRKDGEIGEHPVPAYIK